LIMTTTDTSTTEPLPKSETKAGRSFEPTILLQRYGTLLILVVLLIGASSQSDVFLTERNLLNVLRQIATTGVMAVGMLFVILTRGIDLSVGSIAALGSVLTAILVQDHGPAVAIPTGEAK